MQKILLMLFFASLAIAILLFIKQKNATEQGYEGKILHSSNFRSVCGRNFSFFLFPHIEKYFSLSRMFPAAKQTATTSPTNGQTARPTETPFFGGGTGSYTEAYLCSDTRAAPAASVVFG